MTERDAAVHAAGALLARLLDDHRQVDLLPVLQPLLDRPPACTEPRDLDEAGDLTHG